LKIFGPTKEAAQLESSKIWAKQFLKRNNISTTSFEVFDDAVKAKEYVNQIEYNVVIKILLDSNCAASFVGPNIFKPISLNISTMPIASGASGPTTVKQLFSEAKLANPSKSSTEICTLFNVPPLPGA